MPPVRLDIVCCFSTLDRFLHEGEFDERTSDRKPQARQESPAFRNVGNVRVAQRRDGNSRFHSGAAAGLGQHQFPTRHCDRHEAVAGRCPAHEQAVGLHGRPSLYGNAGIQDIGTNPTKSSSFTAEFTLSVAGQSTPVFDVTYVEAGLKAGAKIDYFSTDTALGTLPAGTYTLTEKLNVGKVVPESNYNNNTATLTFSVVAPPPTTASTAPAASATAQATDQLLALWS